ncbi:hypothetical protein EVAR_39412_1 [Eumeta japonica]|uniref:Uncharacterized protein n=1 Tax=Eumeta variegata TaxID=151549 RepID=A0A4C1Z013_EUMVA|nr:hypothetical protein EVAR_39412_1 [Eumeta japonica]
MSVYGATHCTSHGDSYATFALVLMIYSGYCTVCTPSPRTVSAHRERFRSNPEGFHDLRAVGTLMPSGRLDRLSREAYVAYGLKRQAP